MIDYAVLPPEVNSARMYAGAGSAPMLAAAAGWDRLAAALASTEQSYRAVLDELTGGPWQGNSASAMAAAAEPYLAWMNTTAAQAELTASQARATAAAYEAAFAATVPPSVIAANRAALATLLNTNIFGQNTAAIAANQADYSEMWAQDAAAMHTYAANTAAAAPNLNTFTAAPQTTNPAAAGSQTNTAALASTALDNILNSNPLATFLNSPFVTGVEQLWGSVGGLTMGIGGSGFLGNGGITVTMDAPLLGAVSAAYSWWALSSGMPELASSTSRDAQQFTLAGSHVTGASTMAAASAVRVGSAEVSAGLGRAVPVGELSVPPSWDGASQGIRLAATALPTTSLAGLPSAGYPGSGAAASSAKGSWLGHIPPVISVVNAPRSSKSRVRARTETATKAAGVGGGVDAGAEYRSTLIADTQNASSGRDELNRLRHAVAEMSRQREALECSVASMIGEGGTRSRAGRH